jgi:hypothetical protein
MNVYDPTPAPAYRPLIKATGDQSEQRRALQRFRERRETDADRALLRRWGITRVTDVTGRERTI